jgi:hypothetical protein
VVTTFKIVHISKGRSRGVGVYSKTPFSAVLTAQSASMAQVKMRRSVSLGSSNWSKDIILKNSGRDKTVNRISRNIIESLALYKRLSVSRGFS